MGIYFPLWVNTEGILSRALTPLQMFYQSSCFLQLGNVDVPALCVLYSQDATSGLTLPLLFPPSQKKEVLLNFSLPTFKVNLSFKGKGLSLMLHHTERSPSKARLVSTSSVGRISSKSTNWSLQLLQASHPKK